MKYQIMLSPSLDLTSLDFVTDWNDFPDHRTLARAESELSSSKAFEPFTIAAVAILSTVATGIVTNALYDGIKEAVRAVVHHRSPQKQIEILEIDLADGSRVLVVKESEER